MTELESLLLQQEEIGQAVLTASPEVRKVWLRKAISLIDRVNRKEE